MIEPDHRPFVDDDGWLLPTVQPLANGAEMKYHNHEAIAAIGLDPSPTHGDIVAWVESGVHWRVCKSDDMEGPSALHHWPDGGWCNVRLVARGGVPLPIYQPLPGSEATPGTKKTTKQ